METDLYFRTRTGRTISEKIMEDGNVTNTKEEQISTLTNLHGERSNKLTANGYDHDTEFPRSPDPFEQRRLNVDTTKDEKYRKRINPLRIHLGKRPFVDDSIKNYNICKKKKSYPIKTSETNTGNSVPRVPKLVPKRLDGTNKFYNVTPGCGFPMDNEQDKPVPRLVPKSQLAHYTKGKIEKSPQLKEYAQSLGLQPMVKFKCRKCCSMSFKTLAMLREHQLICRAQAKEPALSPEAAAPTTDSASGGPSRVTKKLYLCSACGTYYENWNLFLHMREVHNRHICLFCLGMFSKAEKLSTHLTNKHNVQELNFDCKEEFMKMYNGTLYLMCCACDEICSEQDDFFNHDCNNVKPRPVPILVSKNTLKTKTVKNSNDASINSPTTQLNETKSVCDKNETKEDNIKMQPCKISPNVIESEPANSDTSLSSDISVCTNKDNSNTTDSGMELDSSSTKPISPTHQTAPSPKNIENYVPNDEDSIDKSDESQSPIHKTFPIIDSALDKLKDNMSESIEKYPVEKEKEGIKLKLSLNKASSPVIINSTVDPTIGQQNFHKPPTRVRRPPKRYEKDPTLELNLVQQKTPSIKMTICDKADSSFVKATIYEDDVDNESKLKSLLNNNLETILKLPEYKPDNSVKTTIYDNNIDDLNTLNRVPKLTVRVPKELLDKDSSSDYSSDSDVDKLTVDENKVNADDNNATADEKKVEEHLILPKPETSSILENVQETNETANKSSTATEEKDEKLNIKSETKLESIDQCDTVETKVEEPDIPITELSLDKPLDKYELKDLLKVFVSLTAFHCIYCNHVRKIAVNCEQLSLHMATQHRFSATVNSITAEELMPQTITAKLTGGASEMNTVYINLKSYDSVDKHKDVQFDHIFECFQCYFKTAVHKDLYLHNRKMHQKTILLCVMCKSNFYSYSELLCHLCPGTYDSEYDVKFRCCLCNVDTIPSSFRLMVHLRKIHHTCDVCLEFCHNQARLSNHVWKHKLHHLCYRCGIAYRNKPDITNHLFWKHGTESVSCKKCLQKKWPHVYHFCTPPAIFMCEECNLQFSKPVFLKVHKRFHTGEYPHECKEEGCTEKFVSKKLLAKHSVDHSKICSTLELNEEKLKLSADVKCAEKLEKPFPIIDLVDNSIKQEAGSSEIKAESEPEQLAKKGKKKKIKEKDALLLDVNLPALDLSESDSSDESDHGKPAAKSEELSQDHTVENPSLISIDDLNLDKNADLVKTDDKLDLIEDEKPSEQQVLDIWDNFKKYQAKVEKQKEKSPPLVPIRKHVCESDHDYCLIPTDTNGDEDSFNIDKKKNKKSPRKKHGDLSSSSSSSSDSDSSCSCGSNCSCSSSSGSSSSSSSDSDSSDVPGNSNKDITKRKKKQVKRLLPKRRISNGSNVDVMGMSETPVLIPEKVEPPIAETDLDTDESETDEEFYDEHPQRLANKLHTEKRNQLMLLASVAPSDAGSASGEASRPSTPLKVEPEPTIPDEKEKSTTTSKKKSKKKKKSKSSKKHAPLKLNIPKDIIKNSEVVEPPPQIPNKITISLQTNTVQIPDVPSVTPKSSSRNNLNQSADKKRASKRRRVPNKFYGYSSDEESTPPATAALKPQQPPKLEWRKEDLPSPTTHKTKKEIPTTILTQRLLNYSEPIRLTAPIPDPEPPRILMNTESMDSSDSDSSEGQLEIYQPSSAQASTPIPPPTYLNSGTSSLPYPFQRPAVRQAREGESVYCYCRCPYDEVSEMIACDAEGCAIEWFHFECVGIMVPPKGKWYCPECRKNQSFSGYR